MRFMMLCCVAVLLIASGIAGDAQGVTVAIDFEDEPIPDLSKVNCIYHGTGKFLYAFLVISSGQPEEQIRAVAAFDVGYKLVSPDESVVNHGFYRMPAWKALDPREEGIAPGLSLIEMELPAAVGYWKLELLKGTGSRAEFQLVPNPLNASPAVTLIDGEGNAVYIPHDRLYEDTESQGLINRTFYAHHPRSIDESRFRAGKIVARFMPGVLDMDESVGDTVSIVDPGLRQVAREFNLNRIKRLFTNATRNPEPIMSRTGELVRPIDKWEVYILEFPASAEIGEALNAILALPRCVYADPVAPGRPTGVEDSYQPNDSLAQESWHIQRIGMPDAWAEELGDTTIHVGIVDFGLDYDLLDFGGGIGVGQKIAGGWDYADQDDDPCRLPGDDASDIFDHGNWTTSTVGAITNNDSGVVGIVGGWGGYEGELGPSIFHFKVREDTGSHDPLYVADALANAYPGYGCQVVAVPYRFSQSDTSRVNPVKEAIADCYKFGTVVVSNFDNSDKYSLDYPACYRNDWVLCLQGTNNHPTYAGDPVPERRVSKLDGYSWGSNWAANYWPIPYTSPDISAPAVSMCHIHSDLSPVYKCNGSGNSYASPIAAGVVALMLGVDPTLSVRDIEGVMAATSTDIVSDAKQPSVQFVGWDKYSGWGRINADSCIDHCWYIEDHVASGQGFIADSSATWELITFFAGEDPTKPLDGQYWAQRFEVRREVTPPTGGFVWGIPCESAGWGWTGSHGHMAPEDFFNLQEPYCDLIPSSQSAAACTLFTFVYKVAHPEGDTLWYPKAPSELEWAYSELRRLEAGIRPDTVQDRDGGSRILALAPNPGNGEISISFQLATRQHIELQIFDVRGRKVATLLSKALEAGVHERVWNCKNSLGTSVAPGVYLCRLTAGGHSDFRKIVLVKEGGK